MMSRALHVQRIQIGNGGWVRMVLEGPDDPPFVAIRVVDIAGSLEPSELYVAGVTSYVLSTLPLGRVAEVLNVPHIAGAIRMHMPIPGPDLRTAASHLGTTWVEPIHWVAEMFLSQVEGSGVPPAPRATERPSRRRQLPDGRVTVPSTTPYPASFWEQLSEVVKLLVLNGDMAPNKTIAEANDVPKTTADRWIRTARRRGYLPQIGSGERSGRGRRKGEI
jgi:hypothetical protein